MSAAEELHPPSVLVVEDEVLVRMMLVDVLEEAGFRVHAAETAVEGVRELDRHPEIVGLLTDVETPGPVDGIALARITHERHPDAAVVVMSGRKRPGSGELPPNARFFGKPYVPDDIIEALHEMMLRERA
ncbi:response regulator [Aureimonas populi]|uniref:Response regulator n=1 Tax=Aureimonas populi TaxID=1701758 RepID=A0ABW5CLN3_9HYPH|nr:response regulator [Aureimonas populi]